MFAGPNGSGKSTLKSYLDVDLLGIFLNPDEMEQKARARGFLDFGEYGVRPVPEEVLGFFCSSSLLAAEGLSEAVGKISVIGGRLQFGAVEVNSYLASVAADFIRQKLLSQRTSFTIETVMSHRSKIELLAQARGEQGIALTYITWRRMILPSTFRGLKTGLDLAGTRCRRTKSANAITVRWICCLKPSNTQTELTFLTIRVTIGTRNRRGWRKSLTEAGSN